VDLQQFSASARSGPRDLGSRSSYKFMIRSLQDTALAGAVPPEFPLIDRKRALGSIASDAGECPEADLNGITNSAGGRGELARAR
jgi:hypothetical protein